MELFLKIVNGWNSLTIFPKNSILDVWQGAEQKTFNTFMKYFDLQ